MKVSASLGRDEKQPKQHRLLPTQARKLLLKATREILGFQSFEAFEMQDVASRASLTRRTIYNQFDSKLELYRASRQDLIFELAQIVVDAIPARMELVDGLKFIGVVADEVFSHPSNVEITFSMECDGQRFPWLIEMYDCYIVTPLVRACEIFIFESTRRSPLPQGRPRLIAEQFVGTIEALSTGASLLLRRRACSAIPIDQRIDIASSAYAALVANHFTKGGIGENGCEHRAVLPIANRDLSRGVMAFAE